MLLRIPATAVLVLVLGCLSLAESVAVAQEDTTPRRLRSPAKVRGFVGGESTDYYVIRARKGQTLTVRVSWKREGDNIVSFRVDDASTNEPVDFGQESQNGKRWIGKLPKTGDYEILVNAHPLASYTVRVTLN